MNASGPTELFEFLELSLQVKFDVGLLLQLLMQVLALLLQEKHSIVFAILSIDLSDPNVLQLCKIVATASLGCIE